jgi:hypothetical protein
MTTLDDMLIHDLGLEDEIEEIRAARRGISKGGPGSGHHGHTGRPGEVGGSQPGDVGGLQPRVGNWRAVVDDKSDDPVVATKLEQLDYVDPRLMERLLSHEGLEIRGEGVEWFETHRDNAVAVYDGDHTIVIGPKKGFSISSPLHEVGHVVGKRMGYDAAADYSWDNPEIDKAEDLKLSPLGQTISRLYNYSTQQRHQEFFAESFALAHMVRPDELDRVTTPRWGAFMRQQFLKGGWKNLAGWRAPRPGTI